MIFSVPKHFDRIYRIFSILNSPFPVKSAPHCLSVLTHTGHSDIFLEVLYFRGEEMDKRGLQLERSAPVDRIVGDGFFSLGIRE